MRAYEKFVVVKMRHMKVHGLSRTAEYSAWITMLRRCGYRGEPSTTSEWHHYGGRGISVCEHWREDFLQFLSDVGKRPTRRHILGRRDVNGNYDPHNVEWTLRVTQAGRSGRNRGITYKGRKWGYKELAAAHCMSSKVLRRRLALGWELECALLRPTARRSA